MRSRLALAIVCVLLVLRGPSAMGQATAREGVERALLTSRDARVRTRAAVSLATLRDPAGAPALVRALTDREPAVRAAAASALGRIGTRAEVAALRALGRDPEAAVRRAGSEAILAIEARHPATVPARPAAPVPTAPPAITVPALLPVPPTRWASTRFVVVLGGMENRSGFTHPHLGIHLRNAALQALTAVRGVSIVAGPLDAAAEREIRRRRIRRYRLDGAIHAVRPGGDAHGVSVRCEVGFMLLDEPGNNLRAALTGAATGSDRPGPTPRVQQERMLAEQAVAGAVQSALRGARQALEGAAGGR